MEDDERPESSRGLQVFWVRVWISTAAPIQESRMDQLRRLCGLQCLGQISDGGFKKATTANTEFSRVHCKAQGFGDPASPVTQPYGSGLLLL